MPSFTVGVDGSDNSLRALEWSVREAGVWGAALTVLTVHVVPVNFWTGHPLILPEDKAEEEKARQAAEETAARVLSELGKPRPRSVWVTAVSGLPAQELINASRETDRLIVGSRGGGGFAQLLLGSVSSQVVQHAACPTTVVPGREAAGRREPPAPV